MKILKRLLIVLFAVVMAFGVFALSACDGTETPNESGSNQSEDGESNQTPEGGDAVSAILGALLSQTIETVTFDVEGDIKEITKDADGKESTADVGSVKEEEKIDLTSGNGDLSIEIIGADDDDNSDDTYSYQFFRGWELYAVQSENGEKPSLSDLEYVGNTNDELIEGVMDFVEQILSQTNVDISAILGEDVSLEELISAYIDVATVVRTELLAYNYGIIAFADAAGGITVNEEDKTIAIDCEKVVKNVLADVKTVVDGLDENSTVADLLGNETVKKYFSIFTNLIPVETVSSLLDIYFPDQFLDITGDDTYDYLVNVICSEDFAEIIYDNFFAPNVAVPDVQISAIATEDETVPEITAIGDYKIAYLLSLAGIDLETLQADLAEYAENVEQSDCIIPINSAGVISAAITYTYDEDYSLTSQTITVSARSAYGESLEGYSYNKFDVTATINYNVENLVFEDISSYIK